MRVFLRGLVGVQQQDDRGPCLRLTRRALYLRSATLPAGPPSLIKADLNTSTSAYDVCVTPSPPTTTPPPVPQQAEEVRPVKRSSRSAAQQARRRMKVSGFAL